MRVLDWTALAAVASLLVVTEGAEAQTRCVDTERGQVCSVRQPIVNGDRVSNDLQKQMGLVTIRSVVGSCSGTLLTRHWVLTARHCVTANARIEGALLPANQVQITAPWAPGLRPTATRIYELRINRRNPSTDLALVYFRSGDLGPVKAQPLYARERRGGALGWEGVRLTGSDLVTQYGQGLSTFAVAPNTPAGGSGTYRSAQFSPSAITQDGYNLLVNSRNQVVSAGDSGGPTVVTKNGIGVGIAGVATSCAVTGYITPPGQQDSMMWATGVKDCYFTSIERFVDEIYEEIASQPSTWQVALSDGTKFVGTGGEWATNWATGDAWYAFVGDVKGDDKADLVVWAPGEPGGSPSTWQVALSDGTKFVGTGGDWAPGWATGAYWHPFVGDVNGDDKADLVVWSPGRP